MDAFTTTTTADASTALDPTGRSPAARRPDGPRRRRGIVRWRGRDVATVVLVLAVLAGIAVRVSLWWEDRAFWRDELGLVQSLDAYSPLRLLGPLADAQSAPPGWLLLVRAVTVVAGDGERVHRLVAVTAGCATLVVVAMLAARVVRNRWSAVVPVLLLATISELVFYTAQTKPYTTDTVTVAWLLLAGLTLMDTDADDQRLRRREVVWYAGIAVLPWLSYGFMLTAPLVAAAVAVTQRRRQVRTVPQLAVRLAGPAASVLAAALHAQHLTSRVSDFASYWAAFLGPRESGTGWWDWHAYVFRELAVRELGFPHWWAILLVVVGFVVAVRRQPAVGLLLALPLVVAYTAGVLGIYPFGRRMVLFCVPGLLVYLAVLVDAVAGLVARFVRVRGAGTLACVLAAAAVVTVAATPPTRLANDLRYLYGVDDYRTALAFVAGKWRDGDVLVVGNGDRTAVRVYGPRLRLDLDRAYRAVPSPDPRPRARCPLPAALAEADRIWLVSGDVVPVYEGASSRYALIAPLLSRFRQVWHQDKGLVTVQAVMPGPTPGAQPARCLDYGPVGPAGAPKFPSPLPAS